MKFVVHPQKDRQSKPAWSWRLETDAGVVLAQSVRTFDNADKCTKELFDLKRDAAVTKVIKL